MFAPMEPFTRKDPRLSTSIESARKLLVEELALLKADRSALDVQIAKLEKFVALMADEGPADSPQAALDAIPRKEYGALTKAIKVLLAKGMTSKDLTGQLHAAGFLDDPADPTPVRTAIKGLRKRGTVVAYDEATGIYRLGS